VNVECEQCDVTLYHWHCWYCGHSLSDDICYSPSCGVPDPTERKLRDREFRARFDVRWMGPPP